MDIYSDMFNFWWSTNIVMMCRMHDNMNKMMRGWD